MGAYEVTYMVKDSHGTTTSKTIQVHIVAKEIKPDIEKTNNKKILKKEMV